jgi:hypothetical protein
MITVGRWLAAACCLACAVAVWAQGLVICGAGGREATPGETVCSHCAAPLPKPREEANPDAAPPSPPGDEGAEVGRAAVSLVRENLRQAGELEKTRPDVALS